MSGKPQQATKSMDTAGFRRVLGHFATGVTVVTSAHPDGPVSGLTASAVASLSLEPRLVLVCIDRTADTRDVIERSGTFAINVLREDDEALARRFATFAAEERFEGVAYGTDVTGSPVLERALAWVDCELRDTYDGGDHIIYVGRVVSGDARQGSPLLYFRGGYGRLTS